MWVKTTCCNMSLSSFKLETPFTMVLYWCSPLPVRRLQPAESYNSLSFSNLSWKGATTPYFFSRTTFHKFSNWIHIHQMIIKYI